MWACSRTSMRIYADPDDADELLAPPGDMEFAADMGHAILNATDEATREMLRQLRDAAIARASMPPSGPYRPRLVRRGSRAGWVN